MAGIKDVAKMAGVGVEQFQECLMTVDMFLWIRGQNRSCYEGIELYTE